MTRLAERITRFREDVRAGMVQREQELRDALGLDVPEQLDPEAARRLLQDPAGPRAL